MTKLVLPVLLTSAHDHPHQLIPRLWQSLPGRSLLTLLAVLFIATGLAQPLAAAQTWQAGVATRLITPEAPMWMSGYASRDRPADGTLHDLWAKALVLQDPQGQTAVLITLDLVGIDRQTSLEICRQLQAEHQLKRSQIALSTSHTHTGPVVGENLGSMYFYDDQQAAAVRDYQQFLIQSVVEVVAAAYDDVAQSQLSWGIGEAAFAVNRRNNREADVPQLRAAGQLQGPVDHTVPVLAVRSPAGQLRAVVFGYACHATVLSLYQWSGDWPGFAQLEIEQRHPEAVAMFVAGCGADQNPLPRRTVELAQEYGRQMANAVDELLADDTQAVSGGLQTAYTEIDLAYSELPTKETLLTDAESDDRYVAARARLLLQQWDSDGRLAATYPYPIQVWQLGTDVCQVFLGGEVVVDYALRLKAEFPRRQIWTVAYANDVMAYIPSLRVLREGGYEGATAMVYYGLPAAWAEDVEELIVSTVGKLLQQVQPRSANN